MIKLVIRLARINSVGNPPKILALINTQHLTLLNHWVSIRSLHLCRTLPTNHHRHLILPTSPHHPISHQLVNLPLLNYPPINLLPTRNLNRLSWPLTSQLQFTRIHLRLLTGSKRIMTSPAHTHQARLSLTSMWRSLLQCRLLAHRLLLRPTLPTTSHRWRKEWQQAKVCSGWTCPWSSPTLSRWRRCVSHTGQMSTTQGRGPEIIEIRWRTI